MCLFPFHLKHNLLLYILLHSEAEFFSYKSHVVCLFQYCLISDLNFLKIILFKTLFNINLIVSIKHTIHI
jgi:hypothetical protein